MKRSTLLVLLTLCTLLATAQDSTRTLSLREVYRLVLDHHPVAKQAARQINAEAEPLLNDTVKLSQMYEGGGGFARTFTLWAAIVFAVLWSVIRFHLIPLPDFPTVPH